jgi:uncharacterized protein YndB with AHSA1/START domain
MTTSDGPPADTLLDIERHLGTTSRRVGHDERDGERVHVVTISRAYDTDVEDLWDAVTNPERIARWFLPVSGDLRLGGHYQLEGNAGGTITRCEPPERLGLTWVFGENESWVELEVRAVDGGAELELQHVAPVDPDFWAQFGPGAVGCGWDQALLGLGEHLSGAPAVEFEDAQAWALSDQGVEFVHRTSEAWGEASIASGTEPAQARAAAERTTAFYTGTGEEPPAH